jgi:hypothetical protein
MLKLSAKVRLRRLADAKMTARCKLSIRIGRHSSGSAHFRDPNVLFLELLLFLLSRIQPDAWRPTTSAILLLMNLNPNYPRASVFIVWRTRKWPRGANCPFLSGAAQRSDTFWDPNVLFSELLLLFLLSRIQPNAWRLTSSAILLPMNLWNSIENKCENKL